MLNQYHALSHHNILCDFPLTIAPGTTLTKMHRPEGARPPDGWSFFVMVPIDNHGLQWFHQTRRVETLIVATIEALVIFEQNTRESQPSK